MPPPVFAYTLVQYDQPSCPTFGSSVRQFRTLRTALLAWHRLPDTTPFCLYPTSYFLTRGSLLSLDPRKIVQIETPPGEDSATCGGTDTEKKPCS